MFKESALLGVYRADGGVHACPQDSLVIGEHDSVFGLAYNQNSLKAARVRA